MNFEFERDTKTKRIGQVSLAAEDFADERILGMLVDLITSRSDDEPEYRPHPGDDHKCAFREGRFGWECDCGKFYAHGTAPWEMFLEGDPE